MQRQEDQEFEDSLGYRAKFCLFFFFKRTTNKTCTPGLAQGSCLMQDEIYLASASPSQLAACLYGTCSEVNQEITLPKETGPQNNGGALSL
jgi:hypothetical protein